MMDRLPFVNDVEGELVRAELWISSLLVRSTKIQRVNSCDTSVGFKWYRNSILDKRFNLNTSIIPSSFHIKHYLKHLSNWKIILRREIFHTRTHGSIRSWIYQSEDFNIMFYPHVYMSTRWREYVHWMIDMPLLVFDCLRNARLAWVAFLDLLDDWERIVASLPGILGISSEIDVSISWYRCVEDDAHADIFKHRCQTNVSILIVITIYNFS